MDSVRNTGLLFGLKPGSKIQQAVDLLRCKVQKRQKVSAFEIHPNLLMRMPEG